MSEALDCDQNQTALSLDRSPSSLNVIFDDPASTRGVAPACNSSDGWPLFFVWILRWQGCRKAGYPNHFISRSWTTILTDSAVVGTNILSNTSHPVDASKVMLNVRAGSSTDWKVERKSLYCVSEILPTRDVYVGCNMAMRDCETVLPIKPCKHHFNESMVQDRIPKLRGRHKENPEAPGQS